MRTMLPALCLVSACAPPTTSTSSSQDPSSSSTASVPSISTPTSSSGTTTTGASSSEPLFGGGPGGPVIPSPCAYPVFEVAKDADILFDWSGLTEDAYGQAIDPMVFRENGGIISYSVQLEAAEALALCGEVFHNNMTGRSWPILPELLPEALADSMEGQPAAIALASFFDESDVAQVLVASFEHLNSSVSWIFVFTTETATETTIALTPDVWVQ